MAPRPPGRPPPSRSRPSLADSPSQVPGGFWFGINYQFEIEGPNVCGRFLYAKKVLQRRGEIDPLPWVFHDGGIDGQPLAAKAKAKAKAKT